MLIESALYDCPMLVAFGMVLIFVSFLMGVLESLWGPSLFYILFRLVHFLGPSSSNKVNTSKEGKKKSTSFVWV